MSADLPKIEISPAALVVGARKECERCVGCGQIASDDEGTPWSYWLDLPLGSALAVTMGFVKPLPCPTCEGSGRLELRWVPA